MANNPYSAFDIKEKVALVVGATGAFGSVASKTYAGAGCKVVLTGGNNEELQKVSGEVNKIGGSCKMINIRPSSEKECKKIVDATVKSFGRIDILLVASGIFVTLAHLLIVKALQLAEGPTVAPLKYVSLVWATILGYLIWGDVPGLWKVVGALMVVSAGLFILYRETQIQRQGADKPAKKT